MFVATVGDPKFQLSLALRRRREEAARSTQLTVAAAKRRALEGFSEKEKDQSTFKRGACDELATAGTFSTAQERGRFASKVGSASNELFISILARERLVTSKRAGIDFRIERSDQLRQPLLIGLDFPSL